MVMKKRFNKRSLLITGLVGFVALAYITCSIVFVFLRDQKGAMVLPDKQQAVSKLDHYLNQYQKLTESEDPKKALELLKREIKSDRYLAKNCHSVAHQIGKSALKMYGSFAAATPYQDAICNSGFVHGVIEATFKDSRDISRDLNEVCKDATQNLYTKWECFHGIGHGVMYYTNNNLPLSLQFCSSFKSDFERGNCANGVYMENFNSEQSLHPSTFVKNDDLFYPCFEPNSIDRDACFYYAPVRFLELNNHNYIEAMQWCSGAGSFAESCKSGVSGQAVKDYFDDLSAVEQLCSSVGKADQSNCIQSAVTMVVNMHGNTQDASAFCESLSSKDFKRTCSSQVLIEEEQFKSTEKKSSGVRFRF
jgi:hypothetical protein